MNVVREIERINQRELDLGIHGGMPSSWHAKYKDSAYIFIKGLDYDLTEGDLIMVFSQFGEVVDCNLARDRDTGKPKGFCFIAYEDQRSTVLAVDNMNGAKLLERTLRVDHVLQYRRPKGPKKETENEIEGVDETDAEYDARRKRIWDYEAYGTQSTRASVNAHDASAREEMIVQLLDGSTETISVLKNPEAAMASQAPAGPALTSNAPLGSSEDKAYSRVMQIMEERKKRRLLQDKAETLGVSVETVKGFGSGSGSRPQPAVPPRDDRMDSDKAKKKKSHKKKHRSRSRSRSDSPAVRAPAKSRSRSPTSRKASSRGSDSAHVSSRHRPSSRSRSPRRSSDRRDRSAERTRSRRSRSRSRDRKRRSRSRSRDRR